MVRSKVLKGGDDLGGKRKPIRKLHECVIEYRNAQGELHNSTQPAYYNSKTGLTKWYLNGQLHREDGPAIIDKDGNQYWYLNGKKHRINGPAVILANGTRYWFQDDRLQREDGPAIILQNGKMEF